MEQSPTETYKLLCQIRIILQHFLIISLMKKELGLKLFMWNQNTYIMLANSYNYVMFFHGFLVFHA